LLCERIELSFEFIRRHKKAYPVTLMCKVLQVSRSGFYDYMRYRYKGPEKDQEQAVLEEKVEKIFWRSKRTYGSRRLLMELRKQGYNIGRYRVRTLMRKFGLEVKTAKRYKVTTDSKHKHPVAANRLDRQFEVAAPNRVWTADISVPQQAA
ncbi:MAG: IS3 family transposase, partial [Deltaproteobacteria bacterium]|nr:IS3 family transposase [Deltaproteobacteria bacterium]